MHSKTLYQLLNKARIRARRKGSQDGFTLVELLIVVVIIGILSAVGIPAYLSQAQKARTNAANSAAVSAARACAAHIAGGEAGDFSQTGITIAGGTCNTANASDLTFTYTKDGVTGTATMKSNGEVEGI